MHAIGNVEQPHRTLIHMALTAGEGVTRFAPHERFGCQFLVNGSQIGGELLSDPKGHRTLGPGP